MYLREMGTVELLSREGEIAIAKRIEAGHEAMIAGLCESPLTFQAIIIWRDELNEGRVLLRDIIDLEATYEGPEAKARTATCADAGNRGRHSPAGGGRPVQRTRYGRRQYTPTEKVKIKTRTKTTTSSKMHCRSQRWRLNSSRRCSKHSIAIANNYKKLRKEQDKKLEQQVIGETGTRKQQEVYDKLREDIIRDVKSLSLNNNRIESLVEQLYAINKRLVQLESQLMRLADSYAIPRTDFITEYYGKRT